MVFVSLCLTYFNNTNPLPDRSGAQKFDDVHVTGVSFLEAPGDNPFLAFSHIEAIYMLWLTTPSSIVSQ